MHSPNIKKANEDKVERILTHMETSDLTAKNGSTASKGVSRGKDNVSTARQRRDISLRTINNINADCQTLCPSAKCPNSSPQRQLSAASLQPLPPPDEPSETTKSQPGRHLNRQTADPLSGRSHGSLPTEWPSFFSAAETEPSKIYLETTLPNLSGLQRQARQTQSCQSESCTTSSPYR